MSRKGEGMDKKEAAAVLEDELMEISNLMERVRCMLWDVSQNYLGDYNACNDAEEFERACIRTCVADEALDRAFKVIDKLLIA